MTKKEFKEYWRVRDGNDRIAERCGWKRARGNIMPWWAESWIWYKPGEEVSERMKVITGHIGTKLADSTDLDGRPPEYYNDLNAIHEAENFLTEEEFCDYLDFLGKIVPPHKNAGKLYPHDYCWQIAHATARQKFEAFLKTIDKK